MPKKRPTCPDCGHQLSEITGYNGRRIVFRHQCCMHCPSPTQDPADGLGRLLTGAPQ